MVAAIIFTPTAKYRLNIHLQFLQIEFFSFLVRSSWECHNRSKHLFSLHFLLVMYCYCWKKINVGHSWVTAVISMVLWKQGVTYSFEWKLLCSAQARLPAAAREMSPRFSPYRSYVVRKFLICFHVFSGAVVALPGVVVSLLLLNPEEKLEIGRPRQGMTSRLKPMLNLRFTN